MTRLPFALILILIGVTLNGNAWAASTVDWSMEEFKGDLQDMPSLQRGFQLYTNYCLGCHGLEHQRYGRTADDFQIPRNLVEDNIIFTGQKVGELIKTSMPAVPAKVWFGATPPDLTLEARLRGPEWIYNYLKTFYVDDERPLGVNNKVYPNVGMPNVLLPLQGVQRAICEDENCDRLEVEEGSGKLSVAEFDQVAYDITNFLYYVGEPARLERQKIGVYALLFILVLICFTYLLKREFFKDIEH